MKKILHIIFSLKIGGTENMLIDIANEQSKTHDVSIIVINDVSDPEVEKMLSTSVSILHLKRTPGAKMIWGALKIYRVISKYKPSIIHMHNRKSLMLFPGFVKILLPTSSYRFTIHTTGIPFGKEIFNVDKVFAISDAVKDDLITRKSIVDISVVHNGIPLSSVKQKQKYQISDSFKIIQIGRLAHEIKGQDILIEAMSAVSKEHPELNISLDIIGGGDSKELLCEMISKLGLENSVILQGPKDKNWIYTNLCEYDLLVQPSRIEGFGLTIIEAMAAKVPVLVSDIEGPMEVINNGEFGESFYSDSIEDCAKMISNNIRYYQQLTAKVDKAYENAKICYNIERVVQIYCEV